MKTRDKHFHEKHKLYSLAYFHFLSGLLKMDGHKHDEHEGDKKADIVHLLKEHIFSIFYILKKTYVFNQSERVEGPIYIIIKKNS